MKTLFSSLLLLSLIIIGCSGNNGPAGGSGMIEADESVISAESAGRILTLFVDEGSDVTTGDTLGILDTTDVTLQVQSVEASEDVIRQKIAAARTQLKQAEETAAYASKEFIRIEKLYSSGTTSQQRYDQVKHELTQAELAVKSIKATIASINAELTKLQADKARLIEQYVNCFPVAPIDGIVTEKFLDIGELAAPGKALVQISNLRSVWVKVYLPAGAFASVKIGDKAVVDTEAGGTTYDGTVVWTSEEAEFTPKNVQTENSRTNLVYAVKVKVENEDGSLKIGMPVFVTLGE